MQELSHDSRLYAPSLVFIKRDSYNLILDPEAPNWVAADDRAAWIVRQIAAGGMAFGVLVGRYTAQFQIDSAKAWLHVHDCLQELLRFNLISRTPVERIPYPGRSDLLKTSRLREIWLHTDNLCNLSCAHCLVNSSPKADKGLPKTFWLETIDQAARLGVERFFITGGEPFIRPDMPELIDAITQHHQRELVVLTNATLLNGKRAEVLSKMDPKKVRFQVSLDGSTAEINDPIRGQGSLAATIDGIKALRRAGFDLSLTTVVTGSNINDLVPMTELAAKLGVKNQHLMWIHRRGRVTEQSGSEWFPSTARLIEKVREVDARARQLGVVLDNAASFELRANSPAGIKFDLGNAGWQSFCVYADGGVYPSAAFANHAPLLAGHLLQRPMESIWQNSPVLEEIRRASVVDKAQAANDPLKFLTGGGDIEHSYFYSGQFTGEDPYYALYQEMLLDAIERIVSNKSAMVNRRSGYDVPRIFHAMGDGAVVCGTTEIGTDETEVAFLHSNCVLSFDVEKPRRIVQEFYGNAAEEPQVELCCPTKYEEADVGHIPQAVLERFYGCGSPVTSANPQAGEVYIDLGSGAGIDCFIAAKRVGPEGRVIGVDMTDRMLKVARENQRLVAQNLGYDAVEFQKGYLESIPVEDKTADIVTSNCVVNLSPDKAQVFAELWRVLKDNGRCVIADIVADREVPPRLKINEQLWGECIVGALTEDQFLAMLEQAGFYGLSVLKKSFWKEIEGYRFYSVTVIGFKFEKTKGCRFIGQKAIYKGPFKSVNDEEGHCFPRNVPVEVCTDTANKLAAAPYAGSFTLIESNGQAVDPEVAACAVTQEGERCC